MAIRLRSPALLALAALLEVAFAALALESRRPNLPLRSCLLWLSAAGLFYLIAVACVVRIKDSPRPSLRLILLAAVVFRLTLLPITPRLSHELWRFHWEGKIEHAGFNPYAYAPDNALLSPIRTAQDRQAPDPRLASFHPPLAELLYRWSYDWLPGLRPEKTVYIAFDLLLIALLIRMLKARRQPPEWALIYAWSPLAVFEVAGNGHMEPAAALVALLALHWAGRRPRPAAVAVASAGLTQWFAVPLIPVVLAASGRLWKGAMGWLIGWSVLLCVPFLFAAKRFALSDLLRNLRAHAAAQPQFNASLYGLAHAWLGAHAAAVLAACLVAAVVVAGCARRLDPLRAAFLILGALLLVMPQVYPWYVLWLLPLVVFFPEAPWLYFSVAVAWAYAVGNAPRWAVIEYIPLYGLLAWQAWQGLRSERGQVRQQSA